MPNVLAREPRSEAKETAVSVFFNGLFIGVGMASLSEGVVRVSVKSRVAVISTQAIVTSGLETVVSHALAPIAARS